MAKVSELILSAPKSFGRKPPRVKVKRTHAIDLELASGSEDVTLRELTPVGYNPASGRYDVLQEGNAAIYTITVNATPATAGTMDIVLTDKNGNAFSATVAFDADIATIKSALEALYPIASMAGDEVTVSETGSGGLGVASNSITITLPAGQLLTASVDDTNLTGNTPVLGLNQSATSANGLDRVSGFIWPDDIVQYAAGSVTGATGDHTTAVILVEGDINYNDIEVPAGMSVATLEKLIKRSGLRDKNIYVTELRGAQA